METFHRNGWRFILDGAHNPISAKELVGSLRSLLYTPGVCRARDAWLVFGAMNDKKSHEMLKTFAGFFSKVILTGIPGNRAKTVGMLVEEAKGLFKCVFTAQNVQEAVGLFKKAAPAGATAVVTGSFYLVGEARKILKTTGNGKR